MRSPLNPSTVLIASDLDGTLISPPGSLVEKEISFLSHIHGKGAHFLFATGRTEAAARALLSPLPFSHFLSAQNGSTLLSFPEGAQLKSHPLNLTTFSPKDLQGWVQVGEGACYYDKKGISDEEEAFLLSRARYLKEVYLPIPPSGSIYSLKKFGLKSALQRAVIPFLEQGFSVVITHDVLTTGFSVAQVMERGIDKGKAILEVKSFLPCHPEIVIGCGDDLNDLPLLLQSDIKIAMANAPEELKKIADLIAPPASDGGLFTSLSKLFYL